MKNQFVVLHLFKMDANQQDLRWWKHLDSTTATVARNKFQHDLDVSAYLRLFKLVSRVCCFCCFSWTKIGRHYLFQISVTLMSWVRFVYNLVLISCYQMYLQKSTKCFSKFILLTFYQMIDIWYLYPSLEKFTTPIAIMRRVEKITKK